MDVSLLNRQHTVQRLPVLTGNGVTSEPADGADEIVNNNGKLSNCTVTFPLPPTTAEIEASGGIKVPNSMGFIYEACSTTD